MMRRSFLSLMQRSVRLGYAEKTSFTSVASQLKSKFRGRGQYGYAKEAATALWQEHFPQGAAEQSLFLASQPVAVSQFLNFFELPRDEALRTVLQEKLLSAAVDPTSRLTNRSLAAVELLRATEKLEPEEREVILKKIVQGLIQQLDFSNAQLLQESGDALAKVLQHLGERDDTGSAVLAFADGVERHYDSLESTVDLVRLFSCFSRLLPSSPLCSKLLHSLLSRDLPTFDLSTVMQSARRMHSECPIDAGLVHRLLQKTTAAIRKANARDLHQLIHSAAVLCTTPRQQGGSGSVPAAQNEKVEEGTTTTSRPNPNLNNNNSGHFELLLEARFFLPQFLFPNCPTYWTGVSDVLSVALGLEQEGLLVESDTFLLSLLDEYILQNVSTLDKRGLGLACGHLHRFGRLNDSSSTLATALSSAVPRLLPQLGELELVHVVAAFVKSSPPWLDEAKKIAVKQYSAETGSFAKALWQVVFPAAPEFTATVAMEELSYLNLCDLLRLGCQGPLRTEVVSALTKALTSAASSESVKFAAVRSCLTVPELQAVALQHAQSRVRSIGSHPNDVHAIRMLALVGTDEAVAALPNAVESLGKLPFPLAAVTLTGALVKRFPTEEALRQSSRALATECVDNRPRLSMAVITVLLEQHGWSEFGAQWKDFVLQHWQGGAASEVVAALRWVAAQKSLVPTEELRSFVQRFVSEEIAKGANTDGAELLCGLATLPDAVRPADLAEVQRLATTLMQRGWMSHSARQLLSSVCHVPNTFPPSNDRGGRGGGRGRGGRGAGFFARGRGGERGRGGGRGRGSDSFVSPQQQQQQGNYSSPWQAAPQSDRWSSSSSSTVVSRSPLTGGGARFARRTVVVSNNNTEFTSSSTCMEMEMITPSSTERKSTKSRATTTAAAKATTKRTATKKTVKKTVKKLAKKTTKQTTTKKKSFGKKTKQPTLKKKSKASKAPKKKKTGKPSNVRRAKAKSNKRR